MAGVQLVSQWEELCMRWHSILWSNPAWADKHWARGNSTLEKCAHPLIMETSKCTQIAALAFTASGSFCKDTASPTPAHHYRSYMTLQIMYKKSDRPLISSHKQLLSLKGCSPRGQKHRSQAFGDEILLWDGLSSGSASCFIILLPCLGCFGQAALQHFL